MRFVNLTPHSINEVLSGREFYPSGDVARVSVNQTELLHPHTGEPTGLFCQEFGDVENLPEPQEGTALIVSALVRTAVPERKDLVSPGSLIRDDQGRPVGCQGFITNLANQEEWTNEFGDRIFETGFSPFGIFAQGRKE